MRSLHRTLARGTAAGITGVLAVSGGIFYLLVRASLIDEFDRSLADNARVFASTMEQGPIKISRDFKKYSMPSFEASDSPAYLEIWLADGSVHFRSLSLGEADLEQAAGPIGSPMFRWVKLPDGRPGRSVGITFAPRIDEKKGSDPGSKETFSPREVTLVLARGTAPINVTLAHLRTIIVSMGLMAIAVSSGVLWFIVRRGLKPMDRLAAEIGRIGEESLSARIDQGGAPREFQAVVLRLNHLLTRLEAAFQRERTLSADVAHELRTPLAGLRTTMDVALSRSRRPEEYREALGDCREISIRMQAMVENLLSLARLEAGQIEVRPEPVVPDDLMRTSWRPMEAKAAARGLEVAWALGGQGPILSDLSLLGLMVRNILENAVAHADEGGRVRIGTGSSGGRAVIEVTNSGSRLPPDQVGCVFERFWRGEAARSTSGGHCGLGLTLVKRIVDVLGGMVEVRSTLGGEFGITVSIPGAGPPGYRISPAAAVPG